MAYGTYDRQVIDLACSDAELNTAINLSAAQGAILTKTVVEPMTVSRFGFRPTTVFTYGTVPTQGSIAIYKYPNGLVCRDLPTALVMCNDLTVAMNAHAADITQHKLADTAAFPIATTVVTDLATMMVQINLMQIAYKAHNTDAIAGGPTYHVAQETTHAPANDTAVTTLATSIAKLNDLLTKYLAHEIDVTGHYLGNVHPAYKIKLGTIALVDADAVGYDYFVDIDNQPVKAVFPFQGLAFQNSADFNIGDQVVIMLEKLVVGGTKTGAFQPYFSFIKRAEDTQNMIMAVDRTPVKAAVSDPAITA